MKFALALLLAVSLSGSLFGAQRMAVLEEFTSHT